MAFWCKVVRDMAGWLAAAWVCLACGAAGLFVAYARHGASCAQGAGWLAEVVGAWAAGQELERWHEAG